ncbi:uncharacterized protein VTP21DRAFT_2499 [Calcarisporiella thermophila]|uniref:uncharacterized protein n=1 Tax=Calcarisporiella thermophila TaxID=911321 RepID=UPI0037435449
MAARPPRPSPSPRAQKPISKIRLARLLRMPDSDEDTDIDPRDSVLFHQFRIVDSHPRNVRGPPGERGERGRGLRQGGMVRQSGEIPRNLGPDRGRGRGNPPPTRGKGKPDANIGRRPQHSDSEEEEENDSDSKSESESEDFPIATLSKQQKPSTPSTSNNENIRPTSSQIASNSKPIDFLPQIGSLNLASSSKSSDEDGGDAASEEDQESLNRIGKIPTKPPSSGSQEQPTSRLQQQNLTSIKHTEDPTPSIANMPSNMYSAKMASIDRWRQSIVHDTAAVEPPPLAEEKSSTEESERSLPTTKPLPSGAAGGMVRQHPPQPLQQQQQRSSMLPVSMGGISPTGYMAPANSRLSMQMPMGMDPRRLTMMSSSPMVGQFPMMMAPQMMGAAPVMGGRPMSSLGMGGMSSMSNAGGMGYDSHAAPHMSQRPGSGGRKISPHAARVSNTGQPRLMKEGSGARRASGISPRRGPPPVSKGF